MTTTEELIQAYNDLRLAEISHRGAKEYAAEATRDLEACRLALELLVKNLPNHLEN